MKPSPPPTDISKFIAPRETFRLLLKTPICSTQLQPSSEKWWWVIAKSCMKLKSIIWDRVPGASHFSKDQHTHTLNTKPNRQFDQNKYIL